MSLLSQLLRPAPPLPPVCDPGWHGATYRHAFSERTAYVPRKLPVVHAGKIRLERNRIEAWRAIKAGATTIAAVAEKLNVSRSQASTYIEWLVENELCWIDKSTMPRTIRLTGLEP